MFTVTKHVPGVVVVAAGVVVVAAGVVVVAAGVVVVAAGVVVVAAGVVVVAAGVVVVAAGVVVVAASVVVVAAGVVVVAAIYAESRQQKNRLMAEKRNRIDLEPQKLTPRIALPVIRSYSSQIKLAQTRFSRSSHTT